MASQVDHLIVAVADLDSAGGWFRDRFGLSSVSGGKHPGHGTANRIVPLGASYVELVAVIDQEEAFESPFGRWVSGRSSDEPVVDGFVLRTDDLDEVAGRLGIDIVEMSREKEDGSILMWRLGGFQRTLDEGLPAYIEWQVDEALLPGATRIDHPGGEPSLVRLDVSGSGRLAQWIADSPSVVVGDGPPSIKATIRCGVREFEI